MLVKTKEYNQAVKNVSSAVSKDDNRPIFENIHIYTKDDNLILEACDGFRLHQSKIPIVENDEKTSFNMLVKKLDPIKDKSAVIRINYKDEVLQVENNLYKQTFDGSVDNYLDCSAVIPKYENDLYIYVNPKYLIDAIKEVQNEIEKSKDKTMVKIQFNDENYSTGNKTIGKISPILITSGCQTNIVLPMREPKN